MVVGDFDPMTREIPLKSSLTSDYREDEEGPMIFSIKVTRIG